ncbi:BRO family protein [Flavobacterium gawalongense]|uniref:Phage antirepressor protein n=1 Tax=Flavobacterium gawalongense TaxID=2594432 RepID=A0A553BYS1_9FLAO|nr:BRO family protein [Flavobacterium gawalongense]TRX04537.1 phage antirepressor protein [Flavobacterium gawalongense]TRX10424.1 phage antirepressor protein [Flavobacterium gawalongense]TRX13472.1 phage antirepressor protein [Flavobacterium gawalongense]TRX15596.1 phage antirepressor protein [Flavobacterium gawalongense]TRX31434.1 phage antirepressor protein [Flavobacterium gawalongense]
MMSDLKLFETAAIRSYYDEERNKWYFSIVDVVEVLTNSINPTDYLKKLRKRDAELGSFLGTNCPQIAMINKSGVKRKTLAGTNKDVLRLIQSIPSPKAEPFKQWLAQVGAERIAEIENPELAQARIRATYKAKGYSDEWIEKRIRGILVRDELTNEWKQRGVKEGKEYAILTAEISKATFGIIPSEYKTLKGLTKSSDNLRDHMTDLELIFTMLGEASTTEIAKNKNAKGFVENHKAAKAGGSVAGKARKDLEQKSGKKIVSKENFKQLSDNQNTKNLE